jgi:MinD-like ATPase involved in chromosome partitioning or flagellar assembly
VSPSAGLRREHHGPPVIDGRPAGEAPARWRRRIQRLVVSKREHDEAELERLIGSHPGVSRANVVGVISPKGGVGKTTSAFVVGNLLADRLRHRAVAVDANPDFGTLAAIAPDRVRSERSLADLLSDLERLHTAVDVRRYMSALPTGLHLLAAPSDARAMAELGPESYGELLALLSIFYEVILLDLGTGVAGPLAQFAIQRADQMVLVSTPEWVTSTIVLAALDHLQHGRTTVVANKLQTRGIGDLHALEAKLRERRLHRLVAVPYDEQLAAMLDTGTYELDALQRPTRLAIKRVGLAVIEQLI